LKNINIDPLFNINTPSIHQKQPNQVNVTD